MVKISSNNETRDLKNDNPYVLINDTEDSERTHINQTTQIYIPHDLLQKAVALEESNCLIRFLTLTDIFISALYFLHGVFFGLICTIISMNGYLSTIYYKKSLMICYVCYQYFQVTMRFINMVFFIQYRNNIIDSTSSYQNTDNDAYVATSDVTNTSDVDNHLQDDSFYGLVIFYYFLLFICQLLIASFVTKYYKLLPTQEEKTRILRATRDSNSLSVSAI